MRTAIAFICGLTACFSSAARAEPPAALTEALAQEDYVRAQALATDELRSGSLDPQEIGFVYEALARASAALGHEDAARDAFVRLLAIHPELRLPPEEPDEQRSRYLEARGFWAAHPVALAASAELVPGGVAVRVTDPAGLVARVRLRVRSGKEADFVEVVRAPSPEQTFPLRDPQGERAYTLSLLDEHGNRLWQHGSDAQPVPLAAQSEPVLGPRLAARTIAPRPAILTVDQETAARRPRLIAGVALLAAGAGLVTGGALSHLEREQLAERWNLGDCSGFGETRGVRCAAERDDITRHEMLAGVLYGAGAVAVIGGSMLLLLPNMKSERAAKARAGLERCGRGPAEVGVSCSFAF